MKIAVWPGKHCVQYDWDQMQIRDKSIATWQM